MSFLNKFQLSLKAKITLTVLLLFLCSIWVLTILISNQLERDMAAQIEAQQFSTASYIADSIDGQVKLRIRSLAAIASLITPELIAKPDKLREFLHGKHLLPAMFQSGTIVVSKDGTVITDYPVYQGRAGSNVSYREYFKNVVATLGPVVGEPMIGRFSNRQQISFAVPVLSRSGQLIAILAGFTLLSDPTLSGTIESSVYKNFPDRLVLVYPKYHVYLTGSDPTRIMSPTPKPGAIPLFDRFVAGFEGSGITVNSRGIRMLNSAKQIPAAGWFVRVGLPVDMAFAPISSMIKEAYLIAFGLSLFSSLLVLFVIRQALLPLYTANKIIRDITEERLPLNNIPVARQDEVGQLLTSFNVHLNYRREAEEELKRISNHNELLLNSTGEGILGLDLEGRHTFVNPSAASMLGYTVEELIGKNSHKLWHHTKADGSPYPEDECPVYEACRKGAVSHRIRNEVFWRKDGSSFPVSYTSTPVYQDNRIVGGVLTFIDITEQTKLERHLFQSQKMEAIGMLAGGIAHDLNNILGAIMGFSTLTQMQIREDDPAKEYLDHLPALIERATTLIKNIMAFSRKQEFDIKPTGINDIVNTLGKVLSKLIREDITLNVKLSDKDIVVNADSVQIEQALMNLTTNARDAMPDGGTLTIRTEPFEMDDNFVKIHGYGKPGKYALLTVEDTGTGIDEKTREKIFEPFFTTKEVGKGTGLGLAMVYGTITQHHGYINVYSEAGEGTTFRIYLPAIDTQATEEKKADAPPLRGGTETILVVEDEASLRMTIKAILEKFGYKVIEAEDGEAGINKIGMHKDEIKLVLMDVIMPRKNGKETFSEIQIIKPDVKVIFMSGHTGDILSGKKIVEEGLDFVPKPISPSNLLAKVRSVLDKGKA